MHLEEESSRQQNEYKCNEETGKVLLWVLSLIRYFNLDTPESRSEVHGKYGMW
jgi:hypothetical protein